MTTRDVPCPGCSPRPEGKPPPSFLQPSCPICKGRGVITQELEDPKVTWVLPSLAFGNLRAAESWTGVSICVNEKPWCCDHPNCQHLPVLDDFASESFEAGADSPVKSRDVEIQGHETNPERLEAIARVYGHCLGKAPLLIHCTGGRERSVLATAYVLVTRHRYLWEPAYELLFSLNSGIFDRREWLDWEQRERLEETGP
jgi:hypothetical protein